MTNHLLSIINGYFEKEVFECNLKKETTDYIIEVFSQFENSNITLREVKKSLVSNRKLINIKQRIHDRNGRNSWHYKPFPVRLGDLKPQLQREACGRNLSMSALVLMILHERKSLRDIYSES